MSKEIITEVERAYVSAGAEPSHSQVGGSHYTKCQIQPWDYVIANNLDYFQGSIIKYVTRWRDKNGVEDLQKAKHFLEKYIEFQNGIIRNS